MSHTTLPTSESTSTETESAEEFVWPKFNPSSGYRSFIDRLKGARLDRKLSIEHLAERVGLGLRLAYEFESIAAPPPFCHMSVW